MVIATGLAATMAIPAVSASAVTSGTSNVRLAAPSSADSVAAFIRNSQKLTVGADVDQPTVTRDNSAVFYAAAAKTAQGVFGGGAMPATSLAESSRMAINSPNLTGGGAAVVQYALQFVGMVPYVLGGNSPSTGFSCDTFVRYVYEKFGVSLPGDAVVEASQGTVIPESEAVMGDLVYYPHQHIGFYDGHGGIVDAPKPGTDVSHRPIWGNPVFIRL